MQSISTFVILLAVNKKCMCDLIFVWDVDNNRKRHPHKRIHTYRHNINHFFTKQQTKF